MKTVTFFSYKGGTGRSLAVANASRYLARLGFKVVALDFDLEAPGLHYKFSKTPFFKPLDVEAGVVDFICELLEGDGQEPPDLRRCCITVPEDDRANGTITLIPAGRTPSESYWSQLASLDWHRLFYANSAVGVKLFLELKRRIETELRPDFLLIDSRTGVTEMGGVATAILPDAVIALVLRTLENLEGSRSVLRSLMKTRKSFELPPLVLTVALSRVPINTEKGTEEDWTQDLRRYLNEPSQNLGETLSIERIEVLHIDEALQMFESTRIGGSIGPNESILYRDYLRFFQCLVSRDEMDNRIGNFLAELRGRMLEDPENVERDLEEFVAIYGHPVAYRELLQFLRLRNRNNLNALRYAQTYWHITGKNGRDPMFWFFVNSPDLRKNYRSLNNTESTLDLQFLESVWRGAGSSDRNFIQFLAMCYWERGQRADAARIFATLIGDDDAPAAIVATAINSCADIPAIKEAHEIADYFQRRHGNDPDFVQACRQSGFELQ